MAVLMTLSETQTTQSQVHMQKSRGFHSGVIKDSILLKCDVASPITQ